VRSHADELVHPVIRLPFTLFISRRLVAISTPIVFRHVRNEQVGFVAAGMAFSARMIRFHGVNSLVSQPGWNGLAGAFVARLAGRAEISVHVDMRPAEGSRG
jgi:hypothetical protein